MRYIDFSLHGVILCNKIILTQNLQYIFRYLQSVNLEIGIFVQQVSNCRPDIGGVEHNFYNFLSVNFHAISLKSCQIVLDSKCHIAAAPGIVLIKFYMIFTFLHSHFNRRQRWNVPGPRCLWLPSGNDGAKCEICSRILC